MNDSQTLDQKIVSGMCTAMFNETYCRRKTDRAARADLWIRCLSALAGTGAVLVWATSLPAPYAGLWKVISVVTAALSALSPILRLDDASRRWLSLAGKWSVLVATFRQIDESSASDEARHTLYLAAMKDSDMLHVEDFQARDNRLAQQSQAEVRRHLSHRLPSPSLPAPS